MFAPLDVPEDALRGRDGGGSAGGDRGPLERQRPDGRDVSPRPALCASTRSPSGPRSGAASSTRVRLDAGALRVFVDHDPLRRGPRRERAPRDRHRRRAGRPQGRAHRWPRPGSPSRCWRAGPVLGGLASSFDVQGVRIERYYHFICRGDDDLVETLARAGPRAPAALARARAWRTSWTARSTRSSRRWSCCASRRCTLPERVRAGVAVKLAQRMREEDLAPQKAIAWLPEHVRRPRLPRDLGAAHAVQVRRARGRDQRGLDLGAHGAPLALAHLAPGARSWATSRAAARSSWTALGRDLEAAAGASC